MQREYKRVGIVLATPLTLDRDFGAVLGGVASHKAITIKPAMRLATGTTIRTYRRVSHVHIYSQAPLILHNLDRVIDFGCDLADYLREHLSCCRFILD